MPNPIDLSKDPFFSKEFARAEKEGFALGFAIGEAKIAVETIINLLNCKKLTLKEIAKITSSSKTFVLEIRKKRDKSYKKLEKEEKRKR